MWVQQFYVSAQGVQWRTTALNEAVELAGAFTALVRGREAAQFDPWLQQAENSAVPPLQRFAKRLRAAYQAVRAALSLDWSNGQTEGQINRLKTIKRQMNGAPASTCWNAGSCSRHDHQKPPRPLIQAGVRSVCEHEPR